MSKEAATSRSSDTDNARRPTLAIKIITSLVLCAMLASPVYGGKELSANLIRIIKTMPSIEVLGIKELPFNYFRRMNEFLNFNKESYGVNPFWRMDESMDESRFNEIKNLTDYQITAILHLLSDELNATGKLDEDQTVHVLRRLKYDNLGAFQALRTYKQIDAVRQLTEDDFTALKELAFKEIKELQKDGYLTNEQVGIVSELTDYEFYGFKKLSEKQVDIVRKLNYAQWDALTGLTKSELFRIMEVTDELWDELKSLMNERARIVRELTDEQWNVVQRLTGEQLDAVWKLTDEKVEVLKKLTTSELYVIRDES